MLYLPLPLYWTLSMQTGSRWLFQTKQMNGDIGFYTIKPDQLGLVPAVSLYILIPLFDYVLYPAMKRLGIQRPLQKMTIGGILMAISFALAAALQFHIDASPVNSVHMVWQLPQNFLVTIADILFQPNGLQFSYEEAPNTMKSVISSLWFTTVAAGNLITIIFVHGHIFDCQTYEFLFFSGLMLIAMLIFSILAYFYKGSEQSKNNEIEHK